MSLRTTAHAVIVGNESYKIEDIRFWSPEVNTSKDGKTKIGISYIRYYRFLETGLGIRSLNSDDTNFVRIVGNVVSNVSKDEITRLVMDSFDKTRHRNDEEKQELESAREEFSKRLPQLHNKIRLGGLRELNREFLQDTAEEKFLCFEDCVVKITSKRSSIHEYGYLKDKLVWESEVIPRSFKKLSESTYNCSLFAKFCQNVSGNSKEFEKLRNIVGYLIHGYNDPASPKVVILQDKDMKGKPDGGTGKDLLIAGVNHIVKGVTNVDGKQFKPNGFPYSQVQRDTKIVKIGDIKPSFKFEFLFDTVTGGLSVEHKGKNVFRFLPEDTPKFVLTTNTPVKGKGESYERRQCVFSLEHYYNSQFSPADEFGCNLFYDFDEIQWLMFDNFMVSCVQKFLEKGLIS